MNSIKKTAFVCGALIASGLLLTSFTNENGGDKNKKYQIIHHAGGETVEYDTVIPMSSSYTPEQFLADKGISSENVEIIEIPSISELNCEVRELKTIVREFELDADHLSKEVELNVEVDDDGNMTVKKTVNGVEVEVTEEELKEIESSEGKHATMIKMRFDDHEAGENEERIEISVEVDNDGNKTITKTVNGEQVEMTEEELENLHITEMMSGDDINIFIDGDFPEGLEDEMKVLEIELEKLMEEGDENVKIITRRIEVNSDGDDNNFEWDSEGSEHRVIVMSSDDQEDFTVVIVTENYDEATSGNTKMRFNLSSEEMDVYPNPNDGIFKIRYESDEDKKTTIRVNDATGKEVFQEKLGKFSGKYEKELNLKSFGSGMYTITIQSGDEKEVHKVMIK